MKGCVQWVYCYCDISNLWISQHYNIADHEFYMRKCKLKFLQRYMRRSRFGCEIYTPNIICHIPFNMHRQLCNYGYIASVTTCLHAFERVSMAKILLVPPQSGQ